MIRKHLFLALGLAFFAHAPKLNNKTKLCLNRNMSKSPHLSYIRHKTCGTFSN